MLFERHLQDFSLSAIDKELALLNFESFDYYNNPLNDNSENLEGVEFSTFIYDYLSSVGESFNYEKYYQKNGSPRVATSRAYNYLDQGGWCYVQGNTIRIKPDQPRYEMKSIEIDGIDLKDKSIFIDYSLAHELINIFPSIIEQQIEIKKIDKALSQETKKLLKQALGSIYKGSFSSIKLRLKARKYEQPKNSKDILIMLKLPKHIIEKIFDNYGLDKAIIDDNFDFWQFIIDNPSLPIIITEGEKKVACLLSQGYIAVGFTGIWKGFSSIKDDVTAKVIKRQLKDYLLPFAKEKREFVFCFDNDTKIKTKLSVESAIKHTAKLLNVKGCKASVMIWDEPFKGIDDLIYHYSKMNLSIIDDVFSNRKSIDLWENKINQSLDKYNPIRINEKFLTDKINQGGKDIFINKNLGIDSEDQIICIKSYKGAGKTEFGANLAREANNKGIPILIITHRVQLSKSGCDRYGVPYITDFRQSDLSVFGTGLCFDSLHPDSQARFKWENWAGAWLFLDEINQSLDHLFNSSTCKNERIKIINTLVNLLQFVIETGGKIFLFDADLSPFAIDYIKQRSGYNKTPKVIENTYQREEKRDLIVFNGNKPETLINEALKQLKEGKKLLFHVSGQKEKSKYGSIALETFFKKRFPNLRILRIDSETVAEPSHGAYGIMENLDYLENYDLVIASPVIETGVSIDIKNHFNSVFGIAWGLQSVNSVCQSLERLRDDVPRYLWVNNIGMKDLQKGGGETTLKSILASTHKQSNEVLMELKRLGIESNFNFDDDDYFLNPELTTWGKIAINLNLDYHNYKNRIIEKLESEGYIMTDFDNNDDDLNNLSLELKENKINNYNEYKEKVCSSKDLEEKEYKELKKAHSRNKKQSLEITKYEIKHALGLEVSPLLVEYFDEGIVSQLKLEYYLTEGKEFLPHRDNNVINSLGYEGNIFKPDINKSSLSLKIKALEILGILDFLSKEKICQADLTDWYDRLTQGFVKSDIKKYLKITLDKRPIQALKQFLGLIGYGLKLVESRKVKDGATGKYKRVNYFNPISLYEIDRPAIFAMWYQKDRQSLIEKGLSPSEAQAPVVNNQKGGANLGPQDCNNNISLKSSLRPQSPPIDQKGSAPPDHPALGKEVTLHGKRWTITQIKDDMAYLINLIGDTLSYSLKALIMLDPEIIA